MATKKKWSREDVGCYADGVHGQKHVRAKLAELIAEIDAEPEARAALISALNDDMSEALDWLDEWCSEDVFWELIDGDLMLMERGDL